MAEEPKIRRKPDPEPERTTHDEERPAARVFGVDVQPLRELVRKVGPLADKVRRRLQDRITGR